MNPSNSNTNTAADALEGGRREEAARRLGERADERRSGERRDDHDEEHDPDFARGEDRRGNPHQ